MDTDLKIRCSHSAYIQAEWELFCFPCGQEYGIYRKNDAGNLVPGYPDLSCYQDPDGIKKERDHLYSVKSYIFCC